MLDRHNAVCNLTHLSLILGCRTGTVVRGTIQRHTNNHQWWTKISVASETLSRNACLIHTVSRVYYQHLCKEIIFTFHSSTRHCAEEKLQQPDDEPAKRLLPDCRSDRRHLQGQTCNRMCLNTQDGLGCHPCAWHAATGHEKKTKKNTAC